MSLPRSVGVLAATDPLAPGSLGEALVSRLRRTLPSDVMVSLYGPIVSGSAGELLPDTQRAASPADLAARSELLLVAVDDLQSVEDLVGGPSGVQAGVHSPTLLVVGATCAPEALRRLAGRLHSTTAGLLVVLDAPLSVRPADILTGQAPILVGAPPGIFLRAEPVLGLLGPTTRVGGLGTGQVAAACTQFLLASHAAVVLETALIAQRSGLDLDRLFSTWRDTEVPGRMMTEVHERLVGEPQSPIPTDLWAAPLGVAGAEARRTQTDVPLLRTVAALYERAAGGGDPEADLLKKLLEVLAERVPYVPETTDPSRSTVGTIDDPGQGDRSD